MGRIVNVSVCQLNQYCLDFEGNCRRIKESIREAKRRKSTLRIGPELEVCGYNADTHFYERDVYSHSYEVLASILSDPTCHGLVIDIGMPVVHNGVRYNARVVCFNKKILLVRPKIILSNEGYYMEKKYFARWDKKEMEDWMVPTELFAVTKQRTVPFGIALLHFRDTTVAHESCKELNVPYSTNEIMVLNGAEIICNSSASYFAVGKSEIRVNTMKYVSQKTDCLYLYSNLVGCDGGRVCFDGGSMITIRGKIIASLPCTELQMSGVSVLTQVVDLDEYSNGRLERNDWALFSSDEHLDSPIHRIEVDFYLSVGEGSENISDTIVKHSLRESGEKELFDFSDSGQDIMDAVSCYLWDYLRCSQSGGFVLLLGDGLESSAVALCVYNLCHRLFRIIDSLKHPELTHPEAKEFLRGLQDICDDPEFIPNNSSEICGRLLVTIFAPYDSEENKHQKTVGELAKAIGSRHMVIPVEEIVQDSLKIAEAFTLLPKDEDTRIPNGSKISSELLLKIPTEKPIKSAVSQARMIISYHISQLYTSPYMQNPSVNQKSTTPGPKSYRKLLVLGTTSADKQENILRDLYESSPGDLNLIGSLLRKDVYSILASAKQNFDFGILEGFIERARSTDENISKSTDLIMSYEVMSLLRYLRKKCTEGPVSMFRSLVQMKENGDATVCKYLPTYAEISQSVKRFFLHFAENRHTASVLTPMIHLCETSSEDHRFDLRPIVYGENWTWQFKTIDRMVSELSKESSPPSHP